MLRNRALSASATALALTCAAASQEPWYLRPASPAPGAAAPSAALDAARGVAVVVGALTTDTLEWNGASWNRVPGAVSPLTGMPIVHDGQDVIGVALGSTWRFDGSSWTTRAATAPAPSGVRLAHDPVRNVVVAFGGIASIFSVSAETWEWNGTSWSRRSPASSPPARQRHGMAFDPARNRVVVFGGQSSLTDPSAVLGDTWEWNGTSWTQASPAASPSSRARHAMIASPEGDGVLLVGGGDGTTNFSDVWIWQGGTWTTVATEGQVPAWSDHAAFASPSGDGFAVYASELGATGVAASLVTASRREPGPNAPVNYTSVNTTGTPAGLTDHSLTAKAGGGFLIFGGRDANGPQRSTYTLDGTAFVRQFSTLNPVERDGHQVVLDGQGRNLLFGGRNPVGALLADTWLYANGQWNFVNPTQSPPARHRHAMAYDRDANCAYVFGGLDTSGQPLADFWCWDGSNWSQLQPAVVPPARSGHGMAYDSDRRTLVVYGGRDAQGLREDVWEWSGTRWVDVSASGRPVVRHGEQLTFDSNQGSILVFGGRNASGFLTDTWEARTSTASDSESWLRAYSVRNPAGRNSGAIAFDPNRGAWLFGGLVATSPADALSDTWLFAEGQWTRQSPANSPSDRWGHRMVYDARRDRLVLFGGLTENPVQYSSETWEWDGANWSQVNPANTPTERAYPMLAYDSARGRTVLFGGGSQGPAGPTYVNDTWEYDGSNWSRVATSRAPSPRRNGAMAFLPRLGAMVLFGGGNDTVAFGDTWLFDGQDWTQASPASAPSARWDMSATYDTVRQTVVMHAGATRDYQQNFDDLWEFDGADWRLVPRSAQPGGSFGPGAREGFGMAFDAESGRTLVFQGDGGAGCTSDLWSWDGQGWMALEPSGASPAPRSTARIAHDASAGRTLAFGGACGTTLLQDVWSIEAPLFGRHIPTGPGCSGGGVSPRLGPLASSDPVIGGTARLRLDDLPSSPSASAFVFVGFSRLPFPLDLSFFGMTGCRLYAATDITYPTVRVGSSANLAIGMPNDVNYLGVQLQTQGVVLAPGANTAGLLTTNGLTVRIGEL